MKTGPEGVSPGSLYAFAHQAYWGFRYLREHKEPLWLAVKTATTVSEIQQIGEECAGRGKMSGAGYGAIGAMTWLRREYVAQEILNAKKHSEYPKSNRPSSEDRRMIFLGVATAAGIFELRIATALRKLAEAGQGLENISKDVHRFDQFKEIIRAESLTWAESVANYFWLDPNGRWIELRELPCEVPTNWLGGYFIFGIEEGECRATFSRTLPAGLDNASVTALTSSNIPVEQTRVDVAAIRRNNPPNVVVCKCGATIAAANRKIALQELREHKRLIHGLKPHPSQKKLNRGPRRPE